MTDYDLGLIDDVVYACNGNCNVRVLLTDNNIGVSGETITLTGLASNLTAITDDNGIATFNITNINETKNISVEWDSFDDNGVIVYHDSSTLNGSLVCLGIRLVDRLEQMGVQGISPTDGLTTLVDEILNINPSVGGIEFDTSIDCNASVESFEVGESFTLTGTLEADYNDTSQADVDLEGFLSGATVKIVDEEDNVLGSCTTDSNGDYSLSYTTITAGNLRIKAVFEGTEYYNECESDMIEVIQSLIQYEPCTSVSSNWIKSHNDLSVTADDTGMTIYNSTDDLRSVTLNKTGTDSNVYDWNSPQKFEFEVVSIGSQRFLFQLYDGQNNWFLDSSYYHINNGDIVSGEIIDTSIIFKINGVQKGSTFNFSGNNVRAVLILTGGLSIKIKNFKVYNVYVDPTPSTVALTGSTDVVTTGETSTITAKVKNADGYALDGMSVKFYENNVLKDTVITVNGEATYTYTGTAKGAVTLKAECGSLQQTFIIYDSIVYDKGLSGTGNHNDIWTIPSTTTFERKAEYSEWVLTEELNKYLKLNEIIPLNSIIEFEISINNNTTGAFFDILLNGSRMASANYTHVGYGGHENEWVHMQLIFADDTITLVNLNNNQSHVCAENVSYDTFRFLTYAATYQRVMKIRNFKLYKAYIDPTPNNIVLTGSTDVVTNNETSTLTAKVKNSDGYSIDGVQVKFYENNVLKDTVTTSGGKATYTYTGTANGLMNIKAECESLQETYIIIDANPNYYDSFSTDTSNRYWYDSSVGNSIAITNDKLALTIGTSRKYVQLRTQDSRSTLDINDYLGKTVGLQCDCDTPSKTRVGIYYSLDGSTYVNNVGTYGKLSNTQEIPSDAQTVLFRVDCTGGSSGDVFNIDNIAIYTV